MWDFSFGKAVGVVARTAPFILLRLAVYVGIGFAYVASLGVGAVLGYGLGTIFTFDPAGGGLFGALIGFGLVSFGLYLAREYILYLVKAAHIAVLVELLEGRAVPSGQSQIGFGGRVVKTHFAAASVLFGVDQLVKAVLRTLFGVLNFVTSFVPGVQGLVRMAEGVVRLSLTYVDEIILAYLIRTRTENPWRSAEDALVLYAQNYKRFLKNALWLAIMLWFFTIAIFVVLLAPAAGVAVLLPGETGAWAFVVAFIFAWGIKAAVLEPVALAALMQVYFTSIAGQTPDPAWKAKLSQTSGKFRELGGRAAAWTPKGSAGQAA